MREFLQRKYIDYKWWIVRKIFGSGEIQGVNSQPDWLKANFDSVLMHWIMKEPLRKLIRLLPDVPQRWLDDLTGSQRLIYEIAKEKWFDCDDNRQRKDKMWKPLLYWLCIWQNDEMAEFMDRLLYEVVTRRNELYIPLGRLDPKNWYMDRNPKLNTGGRAINLFNEDPEVRYDTLWRDDLLVLIERPGKNFICRKDADGKTYYSILNRDEFVRTSDGGYGYALLKNTYSLPDAVQQAWQIEKGDGLDWVVVNEAYPDPDAPIKEDD